MRICGVIVASFNMQLISGFIIKVHPLSISPIHRSPKRLIRLYDSKMGIDDRLKSYINIPNEDVLKSVERSGNKVTAQDLTAFSGIEVNRARAELQNLASLTGGDLEVAESGDIVYKFPPNFRSILNQRSVAVKLKAAYNAAWPYVFYGIRVGFGLVLIASIAIIFSAIFVISSSSSTSDDDRRRGRNEGVSIGFPRYSMWGPSPLDFFYYRPYYGYYNIPINERQRSDQLGFLESIFSYVFGDGDPNSNIERERIKLLSNCIRKNGGAVIAEQIAPYLEPPQLKSGDGALVEESFVLPAVTALGGVPEVTEDGDIVYVFSDLQTTALESADPEIQNLSSKSVRDLKLLMDQRGIPSSGLFEKDELIRLIRRYAVLTSDTSEKNVLLEETVKFSVANPLNIAGASILGIANLGGLLYLRSLLAKAAVTGVQLGSWGVTLYGLMPFLSTYAVIFNVLPLVRWLRNRTANEQIEKRNAVRTAWSKILSSGNVTVRRKLLAAKKMSKKLKVIGADDIIYSTSKDLSEQKNDAFSDNFDDFDRRLKL